MQTASSATQVPDISAAPQPLGIASQAIAEIPDAQKQRIRAIRLLVMKDIPVAIGTPPLLLQRAIRVVGATQYTSDALSIVICLRRAP